MKKYMAAAGALALALAMGGLPAAALADNDRDEGNANAQVRVQTQGTDDQDDQDDWDEIEIELEDDEDMASSLDDLKQKIEERRQELEDEETSTTEKNKDIVENANEVRLAVHALLSSKELLGGIGEQVSEIAKQMNDSVATTTSAEAKIESRSFLVKLFFGGDKETAKVISKEAERNQKSIEKLTELLDQATLSVDFQAALKAQITAIQDAQARLQALAEKEQEMWGLFSWRF